MYEPASAARVHSTAGDGLHKGAELPQQMGQSHLCQLLLPLPAVNGLGGCLFKRFKLLVAPSWAPQKHDSDSSNRCVCGSSSSSSSGRGTTCLSTLCRITMISCKTRTKHHTHILLFTSSPHTRCLAHPHTALSQPCHPAHGTGQIPLDHQPPLFVCTDAATSTGAHASVRSNKALTHCWSVASLSLLWS
jgi:hypothetical protein